MDTRKIARNKYKKKKTIKVKRRKRNKKGCMRLILFSTDHHMHVYLKPHPTAWEKIV